MLYETFVAPLEEDLCVHHIDHNKYNNTVTNLVAMTVADHNRLHFKERQHVK